MKFKKIQKNIYKLLNFLIDNNLKMIKKLIYKKFCKNFLV